MKNLMIFTAHSKLWEW